LSQVLPAVGARALPQPDARGPEARRLRTVMAARPDLMNAKLPVIAVTGMAFEARIARGKGVEAVYAARADLLERALNEAIARGCAGIISFGTAGGLAPDLAPGTLIVASSVHSP